MKTRGLTLLEILIVVSVLTVLIAIVAPRIMGFQDQAKIGKAKKELQTIQAALESYAIHNNGQFPAQTETITDVLKDVSPKMVDQVLYDPFGSGTQEYQYSVTGDRKNYVLSSLGPDRTNGTARVVSLGNVPSSGDDLLATNGTITELDAQVDENNCGTIGTACANGETCTNGTCVAPGCGANSNNGASSCCSGVTVDQTSDDANCGACGTACAAGQTCTDSACKALVTYNGNGNTGGSIPAASTYYANGATVTVLGNTGNFVKTGYTFAGWNTAANGGGTDRAASSTFTMGTAEVILYAKWTAADDCGTPAVGTVCPDGTVYVSATLRTTANDMPGTYAWINCGSRSGPMGDGCFDDDWNWGGPAATGATDSSDGRNNITILKGLSVDLLSYPAAQVCENSTANSKTDWYLPAKNELNDLYTNSGAIGNFGTTGHWSSSELDIYSAWYYFGGGQENYLKGDERSVRCVRRVN